MCETCSTGPKRRPVDLAQQTAGDVHDECVARVAVRVHSPKELGSVEYGVELSALKPFEDGDINAVADELSVRRGS